MSVEHEERSKPQKRDCRLERIRVGEVCPELHQVVVQVAVLVHAQPHQAQPVRDLVACDGEADAEVEPLHHGLRDVAAQDLEVGAVRE